ncbi:MAG: DUF3798 domain-containing protein [Clostridium sp.]
MGNYKRIITGLLIALLCFSLVGCKGNDSKETVGEKKPYKIGLLTPTLSFSEDEYKAAEKVAKKYEGIVKHVTLPDDFAKEQETGMTQITSFADDPDVKAIVICYGEAGILPAIQKVKEKRPDILVVTAPIWDDPDAMTKYVDLALDTDWIKRGETIAQKAKKMGAKTLLHYSFPTHMSMEEKVARRDVMKSTAEKIGLKFAEVTTPDPYVTGDPATAQFVKEDIPKQITKYGKDTAIFGTYCGMQDVIIGNALKHKYIVAEQCCPTPTQGFPAGMNLKIGKEDAGDFKKINKMISEKAKEEGMTGRLSTWPVPVTVYFPQFSVEATIKILNGELKVEDKEGLEKLAKEVSGVDVKFTQLKEGVKNYYLMIMDSIIY